MIVQVIALVDGDLTVYASNTPVELTHQDVYKMFHQGYYWLVLRHFVILFLEAGEVMATLNKCKLWHLLQESI